MESLVLGPAHTCCAEPAAVLSTACTPLLATAADEDPGFSALEGVVGPATSTRRDEAELSWLRHCAELVLQELAHRSRLHRTSVLPAHLRSEGGSLTVHLSVSQWADPCQRHHFILKMTLGFCPLPPQQVACALFRQLSQDSIQLTAQLQDYFALEGRKQNIPTECTRHEDCTDCLLENKSFSA